jgi:uncharacterized protein YndB with AHSA1/START domain
MSTHTVRLHRVIAAKTEKVYRALVDPDAFARFTDRFDDPNLPGEMVTTVTLSDVSVGTELTVVLEGIPEMIPLHGCYLGWQESLANLARLVEPEIDVA